MSTAQFRYLIKKKYRFDFEQIRLSIIQCITANSRISKPYLFAYYTIKHDNIYTLPMYK